MELVRSTSPTELAQIHSLGEFPVPSWLQKKEEDYDAK